jgi:hypothetical protein
MDDANVLSFPSATSSFMKEAIKAAKVVIKKQDIRIRELEKLDDNESIAEMESNNDDEMSVVHTESGMAAELGPKDIMTGVHYRKCSSHPGNIRVTELALLNYKEYCGTQSHLVKRAFATKLIQRLIYEGHRFLTKRGNGWITMSDEQTHFKFSRMMTNLSNEKGGRVKVKLTMSAESIVKLNKSKWNDDDCKTLREYITENDLDDMFMWDHIAKKLNRSERACKEKMRKILDCGIYSEEKEGEIIVFCIVSTSRSIASSVV